jgi:plasmid stabilization system protein ParE
MKRRLNITPTALAELEVEYAWLLKRTPQHAPSWYSGLVDQMFALENADRPFKLVPESEAFDRPLYEIRYGSRRHQRRILFIVQGNDIHVVGIRHGARKPLTPDDIELP